MIYDTNAVSDFLDGIPAAIDKVQSATFHGLPVIVMGEYLYGLEPIPKPDGVASRIIFVCRKEQAKRLYPLRYCPERRDAAPGERRRNPLGQSLGESSGGVASSVTMRRGIAPSSRLANRPAKTLRHLVRLWDRF